MLGINTMKIYTCTLFFVTQAVFIQAKCISETATEIENYCYELFTTPRNWTEAQKYCSNFNGKRSLAKVFSLSVMRSLFSLRLSNMSGVWLGGNDQLQEGEWMWTDGTKANLTSLWDAGQPNNLGGDQDCLELDEYGMLNDYNCTYWLSFICMELHEETSTTSKTNKATPFTSTTTTAAIGFNTVRNESKPGTVSKYTLETTPTTETNQTTSSTSIATTAKINFTSNRNVPKTWNSSGYTLETTSPSVTYTTTNPSSMATTASINFTTERNVSKTENISGDTLEKMNSLGLPEGIGIGTGIGVVVTLLLLAVVLAIMFCCKTKTVNGNLKESGNSTDIENQTKENTVCGQITGTEVEDVKQVELSLYADVLDLQEQSIAYDNMTQTKEGCVQLVEPKETKHLYAEFLDKQDRCYVNS